MTTYLGDPARHFWLTRSVARVMGVNLSEEMATGRLTAQDYAQMVTQCRQCPHVARCEEWLSGWQSGASDGPPGCSNTPLLTRLTRLH